ncbi:MAG: Uma2 family endonuclease [Pyrinomonadaceae bacterium]
MDSKFIEADELGIRLEKMGNLTVWETSPAYRHQHAVDRIRTTIRPPAPDSAVCECVHVADVYVQFPDGSLKRPDISIFCRVPTEQDEAITLIPEAVIEVISKDYEAKDLELGPPFYLGHGVKDLVVFNPYTLEVFHFTEEGKQKLSSPAQIEFACGCQCVV